MNYRKFERHRTRQALVPGNLTFARSLSVTEYLGFTF